MRQKQSNVYQIFICSISVLSVLLSAAIIDVFSAEHFLNMSLLNLILTHVVAFYVSNVLYKFYKKSVDDEIKAMLHYVVQYFLLITLMLFLDKTMTLESRSKLVYMVILHTVILYIVLKISKEMNRRYYQHSRHKTRVMLVTTSDRLNMIATRMKKKGEWGGQIASILLLDVVDRSTVQLPQYFEGASRVDMTIFEKFITRQVVDEVFIHVDSSFDMVIGAMLPVFEELGIDVNVNISAFDISSNAKRKIEHLASFSVIRFSTKFYSYYAVMIKRIVDIVVAIIGLIITIPVAIILVPIIKLDSKGPAIFAQNRVGKNGRIFKFYKFRSMVIDAEEQKEALMARNEMDGLMFKMEDDPRITKVGKFIRKTSIDELPQFLNILLGDMSLVGTRPPTVEEYEQYTRRQKKRLALKPGITGLWQVSGRSEITDFDEVVKLDIEYIDNWSLSLDLKIILKTFKIVILGRGAK